VLIPHGNTVLKPGDMLVAVTEGKAGKALRDMCTAQEKSE
jgi:Trk K+ transport system NAD-binding subunit